MSTLPYSMRSGILHRSLANAVEYLCDEQLLAARDRSADSRGRIVDALTDDCFWFSTAVVDSRGDSAEGLIDTLIQRSITGAGGRIVDLQAVTEVIKDAIADAATEVQSIAADIEASA